MSARLNGALPAAAAWQHHLPLTRRARWQAIDAAVVLATTAMQAGLVAAVASGVAGAGAALAAHAVVVAVLAQWAWSLHATGRAGRLAILFAVSTATLGPLGAPGTLLTWTLREIFARRAVPFETWYASLFPTAEANPTRALHERIVLRGGGPGHASGVAPFADVICTGTIEHKQAVITLIADHFRPGFAPALRGALNDAEPAIRVQAATAAARIENRFLAHAMALKSRLADDPDRIETLRELARHHDDYAGAGLLEAGRAADERRRALALYERCARLDAQSLDIQKAIARLLVRLGRHEEVAERFGPLVARGEAPAALVAWYLESLYRLGRFDALSESCLRLRDSAAEPAGLSDELRQAMAWWADGGRLAEQAS